MIEEPRRITLLRRLGFANVAYLVAVIVWGAYVRISFSGDGCGDHWPLCQGRVLPVASDVHTAVEFSHRVTSALCGFFAIGLVVAARRIFGPGHPARRHALAALGFVVAEGLFGAMLVRLRLVGHDTSVLRAYVMALHLCNTFALLAFALAFTERSRADFRGARGHMGLAALGYVLLGLVGASGALAALGDTLFPSETFRSGVVADLTPGAHPFVQLRVFHPLLALAGAAVLLYVGGLRLAHDAQPVRSAALALVVAVSVQVALGFANLLANAPVLGQLAHLAVADLVFLCFHGLVLRLRVHAFASANVGEPAHASMTTSTSV